MTPSSRFTINTARRSCAIAACWLVIRKHSCLHAAAVVCQRSGVFPISRALSSVPDGFDDNPAHRRAHPFRGIPPMYSQETSSCPLLVPTPMLQPACALERGSELAPTQDAKLCTGRAEHSRHLNATDGSCRGLNRVLFSLASQCHAHALACEPAYAVSQNQDFRARDQSNLVVHSHHCRALRGRKPS